MSNIEDYMLETVTDCNGESISALTAASVDADTGETTGIVVLTAANPDRFVDCDFQYDGHTYHAQDFPLMVPFLDIQQVAMVYATEVQA